MLHVTGRTLKYWGAIGGCVALALCAGYVAKSGAQSGKEVLPPAGSVGGSSNASPIYGITIPPGYREWKLISINHLVTPKGEQLRAQLGNDAAIKAFRDGKLPFPDGAIIAAIHWTHVSSEQNNKVLDGPFPGDQSFIATAAINVQFMVKDSRKYAATGGWGFADFKDGKPGDKALHETCFPCHVPAKDRDFVFAHYAPTP
jgi:hypothetical protein